MVKKLFTMEKRLNRKEIAEHMRKIADGVEKGSVRLGSGTDSVELHPSETPEFEIEVEEEADGDKSLELEVEWDDSEDDEELEIG
jgi:amphi-Trp domain-containing protein